MRIFVLLLLALLLVGCGSKEEKRPKADIEGTWVSDSNKGAFPKGTVLEIVPNGSKFVAILKEDPSEGRLGVKVGDTVWNVRKTSPNSTWPYSTEKLFLTTITSETPHKISECPKNGREYNALWIKK